MKKIITALQNENVNKKLSEHNNIKIMANDIQYQEGILEILELDSNIDYIIFSELLPGEISIKELVKKINKINFNIQLIIILEKKNKELEEYLLSKNYIKIIYNNQITINELIEIIRQKNEKEEIKKIVYNENDNYKQHINNKNINLLQQQISKEEILRIEEEINNEIKKKSLVEEIKIQFKKYLKKEKIKKQNKTISIIGENGVGKTTFTINLANIIKKEKNILIIDTSDQIQEILFLLNYKNNENSNVENIVKKIDKRLDVILLKDLPTNKLELIKQIKKLKQQYKLILIDIKKEKNSLLNIIFEESDKIIFLMEPNILQIKKSFLYKQQLIKENELKEDKIYILLNKEIKNIIFLNVIKEIFNKETIIGKIRVIKNYNKFINSNMNIKLLNKTIKKEYKKIAVEIYKNEQFKKYYLNRIII